MHGATIKVKLMFVTVHIFFFLIDTQTTRKTNQVLREHGLI